MNPHSLCLRCISSYTPFKIHTPTAPEQSNKQEGMECSIQQQQQQQRRRQATKPALAPIPIKRCTASCRVTHFHPPPNTETASERGNAPDGFRQRKHGFGRRSLRGAVLRCEDHCLHQQEIAGGGCVVVVVAAAGGCCFVYCVCIYVCVLCEGKEQEKEKEAGG